MPMIGSEFATAHMEGLGWSRGTGLGKNGQGIVDAIKPKLKFDQSGVGHNRAEEFEFQWWDHVFNKAAKSLKVDDKEGEVKVDFNSDKSELSTKKMRRKLQKEMKKKLYSNFVKSGTLTGGNMVEEPQEETFIEDKDMSKIKELSDDQLVAACGGRTAHKGGRHGLKMKAKLDRIAEAERLYMENYNKKKSEESLSSRLVESERTISSVETQENIKDSKRKKKKHQKDSESDLDESEPKKKKKKTKKSLPEESEGDPSATLSKKKKKKN